jgi:8-oxo-dGTP pyrophosphatase MutT (NUDIX family)
MSAPRLILDDGLRSRMLANLERFERKPHRDESLTHAAVTLLVTADEAGDACFVITRRAARMKDHPGQWALPGGRLEPGESATDAALRETGEEVGLQVEPSSVLGLLDDYPTRSGFVITPVVVWGGAEAILRPDPEEVAAVYRVPLLALEAPQVPRLRQIPESDRPVISVPIEMLDADIHAPTAAILYQLREVALRGASTRVAHYEQPVFAWR